MKRIFFTIFIILGVLLFAKIIYTDLILSGVTLSGVTLGINSEEQNPYQMKIDDINYLLIDNINKLRLQ